MSDELTGAEQYLTERTEDPEYSVGYERAKAKIDAYDADHRCQHGLGQVQCVLPPGHAGQHVIPAAQLIEAQRRLKGTT